MKLSNPDEVQEMYDTSAEWYAEMMDSEIGLPIYSDVLGRLSERISNLPGTVIDSSCGSGHMLSMYHQSYDQLHPLRGIDRSPRMITISQRRLGDIAKIELGDMCKLDTVDTESAAAVINFFSLHHLDQKGITEALSEWHRVLRPNGQLVIATWEGVGPIDYGNESDVVAFRYRLDEISAWVESAGFSITRSIVEPVEEMPMDAIYLEGVKV